MSVNPPRKKRICRYVKSSGVAFDITIKSRINTRQGNFKLDERKQPHMNHAVVVFPSKMKCLGSNIKITLTLTKDSARTFIPLDGIFFSSRDVVRVGIGGASHNDIRIRSENPTRNQLSPYGFPVRSRPKGEKSFRGSSRKEGRGESQNNHFRFPRPFLKCAK